MVTARIRDAAGNVTHDLAERLGGIVGSFVINNAVNPTGSFYDPVLLEGEPFPFPLIQAYDGGTNISIVNGTVSWSPRTYKNGAMDVSYSSTILLMAY